LVSKFGKFFQNLLRTETKVKKRNGSRKDAKAQRGEKFEGRADSLSPPSRGRGPCSRWTQSAYMKYDFFIAMSPMANP